MQHKSCFYSSSSFAVEICKNSEIFASSWKEIRSFIISNQMSLNYHLYGSYFYCLSSLSDALTIKDSISNPPSIFLIPSLLCFTSSISKSQISFLKKNMDIRRATNRNFIEKFISISKMYWPFYVSVYLHEENKKNHFITGSKINISCRNSGSILSYSVVQKAQTITKIGVRNRRKPPYDQPYLTYLDSLIPNVFFSPRELIGCKYP